MKIHLNSDERRLRILEEKTTWLHKELMEQSIKISALIDAVDGVKGLIEQMKTVVESPRELNHALFLDRGIDEFAKEFRRELGNGESVEERITRRGKIHG